MPGGKANALHGRSFPSAVSEIIINDDAGKTTKKGKDTPPALSSRYMFANGDKYEGEYEEKGVGHVVRVGTGRHTSTTGTIYSGMWAGDVMNGRGEIHHPTGACYKGDIVDGQYHGEGTYKWPDGSAFTGPFVYNRMEGRGVYTDTAGRQWVGMFSGNTAQNLRLKLK